MRYSISPQRTKTSSSMAPSHQRDKSGCFTCRIRGKKCQGNGSSPCPKCVELMLPCLGYGRDAPEWIKYNKDALRILLRDHVAQSSQELLSLEKFYPEGWTPFFASPRLGIPPRSVSRNDINDAKEVKAILPPLHIATATAHQAAAAAASPPRLDPRLDSANATVESEPTQYLDEFRFYHDPVPPRIWGEISYLLYRPSPEPELHIVPNPERAGIYQRYASGLHTSPRSVIRPRDHPLHLGRSQFTGNAEGLGYWTKRGERRLGDIPLPKVSPSGVSDNESLSTVQSLFS